MFLTFGGSASLPTSRGQEEHRGFEERALCSLAKILGKIPPSGRCSTDNLPIQRNHRWDAGANWRRVTEAGAQGSPAAAAAA